MTNLKGSDGVARKRRGIFKAIGFFSKELQGDSDANKTMESKFKMKFDKSKCFREMVEKMRENDQAKFRLKFGRDWMRC
jgi:hypothetical protein